MKAKETAHAKSGRLKHRVLTLKDVEELAQMGRKERRLADKLLRKAEKKVAA